MIKTCNKCGAKWVDGQLYWSTGKPGSELDLAGLVCNKYGNDECVNPVKGQEGGDTWAKRQEQIESLGQEFYYG